MPTQEEIDDQLELLSIYRRNLARYLKQRATFSDTYVPPNIANGIDEERNHILWVKGVLRGWGVGVNDHPHDSPQLEADSSPDQVQQLLEPSIPNHFEDRENEAQKLISSINDMRWCGIFGIGGTGKTTLAAYIVRTTRVSVGMTVIWLDLGQETPIERVLETLAQAVGHSLRTVLDPAQRCGYLRAVTNEKRLLIVFDDVNDENTLKTLLNSVGKGNVVIVTGRNQGLSSITKYGLEVLSLDALPQDAATKVLLKLVNIHQHSINSEKNDWGALAKSVGYLPLALEIVAGDINFRSNRDPADYLKTRIRTGKWSKSDEFSERLKMTFDQSIQRISEDHQQAFACLGIFVGEGFDSNAVRAVCGFESDEAVEEFLSILRKRYLIQDQAGGTLSLHPVLRQYAQDLLVKQKLSANDRDTPISRYIVFCFQLLRQYGGYEWNLGQYSNLIPYELEIINAINTAFDLWQNSNIEEAKTYLLLLIEMTFLISWYLNWRGYWDLRIQFCQRITDNLEGNDLLADRFSRYSVTAGNLYVDRGWIYLQRKEIDKANNCAQRGEYLLHFSGDLIFAKELKAQVYLESGNPQAAHELFLELCKNSKKNTRIWFVFSLRLSDALVHVNKQNEAIEILENLLLQIPSVYLFRNEIISDVHARIAFRLAHLLPKEENVSRIRILIEDAVELFNQSGIVDQTTVKAQIELAQLLLSLSGEKDTAKQLLKRAINQAQIIGEIDISKKAINLLQIINSSQHNDDFDYDLYFF